MKDLGSRLAGCTSEEEVKYEFAKYFKYKLDTRDKIDLYSDSVLYEFKYDVNLRNAYIRAKVFAQALYYIRRLKYGSDARVPSRFICVVDKNEAVLIETIELKDFYYTSNNAKKYDWDLKPSNPDKKLIEDLSKTKSIIDAYVYNFSDIESQRNFIDKINLYKNGEQLSLFDDKKEINEYNFYPIFLCWRGEFEEYVENGRKSSEYYVIDIEQGRTSIIEDKQVMFRMNNGEIVTKNLPIAAYAHFWKTYAKVQDNNVITSIRQKMDRMTEIEQRRFTGEFFTPLAFAEKALDYIYRIIGKKWWESGKYRIWDMASGTGNLEYNLPAEALKYCYMSTLLEDDVNYCRKIYPDATVFQYDYLNDDVNFLKYPALSDMGVRPKMPDNLIEDLRNPEIKWILFFNPPYVTSNDLNRDKGSSYKNSVSMTEIQKIMHDNGLGETSRELVSQFLYRIDMDFAGRNAYLAMFSKIKYINSTNDQKLRDTFFHFAYKRGFIFSSKNFDGCKQVFPVGFMIWDFSNKKDLEKQKIIVDVFDEEVEKIGTKHLVVESRKEFLSKWIEREKATIVRPPFSSAITVADKNKDRRDRVAEGFLVSFMCKGNDYANQNYTSFLSSPYVSAGALSVTPRNFEKAMIVSVVRRLPKVSWLNDRDQMMQPTKNVLEDRVFVADCVVWALFSTYNDTVSMNDVVYEGRHYRIKNEFFPFILNRLRKWNIDNPDIRSDIFASHEDRYAAKWIEGNDLSDEANEVFNSGKKVYKYFYEHLNNLPWMKYKISRWDVGWWQVRMSLQDFGLGREELDETKGLHRELGEKILMKIYEYGFINPDMDCLD